MCVNNKIFKSGGFQLQCSIKLNIIKALFSFMSLFYSGIYVCVLCYVWGMINNIKLSFICATFMYPLMQCEWFFTGHDYENFHWKICNAAQTDK